jgi:Carboxypeptidase regulatory-like domain
MHMRVTGRRSLTLPGALLLVSLAMLLAACGLSSSVPGAGQGTLTGDVQASPTCPVERAGQTCPPAPVPTRQVQILDANGKVAATTTTDAHGHFSVTMAPGSYVVKVAIVRGQVGVRQITPGKVTVTAGQTTTVTIEMDTGIR